MSIHQDLNIHRTYMYKHKMSMKIHIQVELGKIAADQIMKNSTQVYTMSTPENCQQSRKLYVDDHLLDIVKSEFIYKVNKVEICMPMIIY